MLKVSFGIFCALFIGIATAEAGIVVVDGRVLTANVTALEDQDAEGTPDPRFDMSDPTERQMFLARHGLPPNATDEQIAAAQQDELAGCAAAPGISWIAPTFVAFLLLRKRRRRLG